MALAVGIGAAVEETTAGGFGRRSEKTEQAANIPAARTRKREAFFKVTFPLDNTENAENCNAGTEGYWKNSERLDAEQDSAKQPSPQASSIVRKSE